MWLSRKNQALYGSVAEGVLGSRIAAFSEDAIWMLKGCNSRQKS